MIKKIKTKVPQKWHGYIVPSLIIALTLIMVAILVITSSNPPSTAPQARKWPVAVIVAKPLEVLPQIVLYGRVESPRTAELTAAIDAYVVETPALEGASVAKDEIIVQLDPIEAHLLLSERISEIEDIKAQIEAEKNKYIIDLRAREHDGNLVEILKRSVSREQKLLEKKVGSEARLDEVQRELEQQLLILSARDLAINNHKPELSQLQARLDKALALKNRAQLDVERSSIKSPFSGRVAQLNVAPGDRVSTNQEIVEVYDDNALEIRAQIPSRYLALIRPALQQQKAVTAASFIDKQKVNFKLDRLAAKVISGQGGVDGLFKTTEGGEFLELGRALSLLLSLPVTEKFIPVPLAAIYNLNNIYVVKDDRLDLVSIERLGTWEDAAGKTYTLISAKNITAGSKIVITQLPSAIQGLPVTITETQTVTLDNDKSNVD